MSGRISAEVIEAMDMIREGASPYAAALTVGVQPSTIYRSALYKQWKAAAAPTLAQGNGDDSNAVST